MHHLKNLLFLPLLTAAAGLVLRLVSYLSAMVMLRGKSDWTLDMSTQLSYIYNIMSIVLFAVIVFYLRRRYTRKAIAVSATALTVYSAVILLIEQVSQHYGAYPPLVYNLFLPAEMFTWITSALMRTVPAEHITWIYAVPALFAPYLFVLFGKRTEQRTDAESL